MAACGRAWQIRIVDALQQSKALPSTGSPPWLFTKCTKSRAELLRDLPGVHRAVYKCKTKKRLLKPWHGKSAWAQQDFTWVRKQLPKAGVEAGELRHLCLRHGTTSWKAWGRSSRQREIFWDAKVGGRTGELKEWTSSQKNYQPGYKTQGLFAGFHWGSDPKICWREQSWFTLTIEANGELFLTKTSTKL